MMYKDDAETVLYRNVSELAYRLSAAMRTSSPACKLLSISKEYEADVAACLLGYLRGMHESDMQAGKAVVVSLADASDAFQRKAQARANLVASLYLRRN